MAGYLAPFSLFLGLMLAAVPSAAFESKYQGRPLRVSSDTGPLTWTCMAEYAASTGYYRGTGWTRVSTSAEDAGGSLADLDHTTVEGSIETGARARNDP
jgi:hypothetical protein